jgi:hypothetical protein
MNFWENANEPHDSRIVFVIYSHHTNIFWPTNIYNFSSYYAGIQPWRERPFRKKKEQTRRKKWLLMKQMLLKKTFGCMPSRNINIVVLLDMLVHQGHTKSSDAGTAMPFRKSLKHFLLYSLIEKRMFYFSILFGHTSITTSEVCLFNFLTVRKKHERRWGLSVVGVTNHRFDFVNCICLIWIWVTMNNNKYELHLLFKLRNKKKKKRIMILIDKKKNELNMYKYTCPLKSMIP